jgi:hypothetical protein
MIKKFLVTINLTLLFFILGSSVVEASILSVDKDGEITWKVLSKEDSVGLDVPTHSYIEVKKVGDDAFDPKSSIELSRRGDKISLFVLKDNEKRQIDIANPNGDLIEIEERAEIQKINIGIKDDKFSLQQRGFSALTEFPIKIDPATAKLTVETKSGDRFLSILPYQAVEGVLRSRLISRIDDNRLEIIEEERELQYSFSGEKVFNIFDLFEYSIPVSLRVSASTGETISIEGPVWYKIVGFFLS